MNTIKKLRPWNWLRNEGKGGYPLGLKDQLGDDAYYPSQLWSLHDDIDKIFDNALHGMGFPRLQGKTSNLYKQATVQPKINIDASDQEYRVSVEIPGVEEKDLKIDIGPENTLIIHGEKKQENEDKERNYYYKEFSYGSFERVLSLPEDVDQSNVKAYFKNGVLTIKMSRKTFAKSQIKQIPIESGEEGRKE